MIQALRVLLYPLAGTAIGLVLETTMHLIVMVSIGVAVSIGLEIIRNNRSINDIDLESVEGGTHSGLFDGLSYYYWVGAIDGFFLITLNVSLLVFLKYQSEQELNIILDNISNTYGWFIPAAEEVAALTGEERTIYFSKGYTFLNALEAMALIPTIMCGSRILLNHLSLCQSGLVGRVSSVMSRQEMFSRKDTVKNIFIFIIFTLVISFVVFGVVYKPGVWWIPVFDDYEFDVRNHSVFSYSSGVVFLYSASLLLLNHHLYLLSLLYSKSKQVLVARCS